MEVVSRGRGRPRKRSENEAVERERALQRERYKRKKSRESDGGGDNEELGTVGRPRKTEGTEEELKLLEKRRESYQKSKEGKRARGRPRVDVDESDERNAKREKDRRYYERKKARQLKVKLFPAATVALADDASKAVPPPILKSPATKSKRKSQEVLLLSPSKEQQHRLVRPSDDVTPKGTSAMGSWRKKRRQSLSPDSNASSVSPASTPASSRASSPSRSSPSRSSPSRSSPSRSSPSRSSPSRSSPTRSSPSRSSPSQPSPSRSPASRSPASRSPASRSPASRSPASRSPASRSPAPRSPASRSPASRSPESRSSSRSSSRGPKRKRERDGVCDERKRKERCRKRKWRDLVARSQKQLESQLARERQQSRERVAKHRQRQTERKMAAETARELVVARKIVTNLRARLDKNRGNGTMQKEERAFRRMVAEAIVGGPEMVTREEIHESLGISKNMVADARKVVREEKESEQNHGHGRRLKSRLVTSALQRRRKTTKFDDVHRRVRAYYEEKSTPTSRRRDVIKCWVNGQPETRQKRFLSDSITRLHEEYIRRHGPVSRGLFFSLRPKWIFAPTDSDRMVCLCSRHTTLKFAFEDFVKICKKNNISPPNANHYVELMDEFLCDDDERTRDCLKEDCSQCGITLLDDSLFSPFLRGLNAVEDVTYRSLEKDENGRLGIFEKQGSPSQFVDHVKAQLRGFPLHRFVAKNQQQEQEALLRNLDPETVVILSDYAEKFTVQEFEEIQSLHWHSQSFTIFNSVAYFLIPDPNNPKEFKKVKFYFSFFTERPEQDNHLASFCIRRVLTWIKDEFHLSFKRVVLCSDKCGAQFCSRKVFGSLAESRRNLCVDHQTSDPLCPNCPQAVIHFSAAGHGKCEIDSLGAGKKTALRRKELAGNPIRTLQALADFLKELNFVDFNKTKPGKEDSKGFFFSGSLGEVIKPEEVSVTNADWERVTGTRDLHQLMTTSTPGEMLIRESSCFTCAGCEFGDYENCRRTDELGSVEKVKIRRIATSASTVRSVTRTRTGQDRHRRESAELAKTGSVIAIARGQHQEISLILVTAALGELSDSSLLKGKILVNSGETNRFSSAGAKLFSFTSELVRSPPLLFNSFDRTVNGKKETIFEIEDYEMNSLSAEFLF